MKLRNLTRDTYCLNLLDGSSLMLPAKEEVSVDDRIEVLDAPEVQERIRKGHVKVVQEFEKKEEDTEKETKEEKKPRFGKKNRKTEE